MEQKILKAIKILNRFSINDIIMMTELEEEVIFPILQKFIESSVIKKISQSEYAYIKTLKTPDLQIPHNSFSTDKKIVSQKPLPQYVSIVDADEFIKNAPDYAKPKLIKYITVLKLGEHLCGQELRNYLAKIAEKNPQYAMSYGTYRHILRLYISQGLNGLIPRQRRPLTKNSCLPQEVHEDFEKLYFSGKEYSLETCIKILENKYPDFLMPTSNTFYRHLRKKYSCEMIQKLRRPQRIKNLPNISIEEKDKEPQKRCTQKIIETQTLTNNEINEIIKVHSPALWMLILGLSVNEISALNFEDINFEQKTVLINKLSCNGKIVNYRSKIRIRRLTIPDIIFSKLKEKTGRIFKNVDIKNADILLNTHIQLMLKQNVQVNIIAKKMGIVLLANFVNKYSFLLPQNLNDDFDILKGII